MRILYGILFSIACLIFMVCGTIAQPHYPSLRDSFDPVLQGGLEQSLARLGFMPAVQRKQLSVALVDITVLDRPRVAAVNGDEMIYAASLPKIAILLGAFVLIERGEMVLDTSTRDTLTRMIRVSSNTAATTMLHRIGKPRLAAILRSDRFRLYDPRVNGGLWVGKDYGKVAAWKRDPLHHLSHGATALQAARFYYLLETKQLMAPKLCQEMKRMLSRPGLHHKFVAGLAARPGSRIYRKSGSWRRWHADSAIVERDGYKYIAVALVHHQNGGKWLSKLIVSLDDLIVQGPGSPGEINRLYKPTVLFDDGLRPVLPAQKIWLYSSKSHR
jgi:beta-lactamase class A